MMAEAVTRCNQDRVVEFMRRSCCPSLNLCGFLDNAYPPSSKMTLITPLCQFPAEINNVIFSYLNLKQLLECSLVCRQWRDNIPTWIHAHDRSLHLNMKRLNNARPSLQYLGRVVQGIHFAPWGQGVNVQQVLGNLLALDLPHVDTLRE